MNNKQKTEPKYPIYCSDPNCKKKWNILAGSKEEDKLYRVGRNHPEKYQESIKIYFCNEKCYSNEVSWELEKLRVNLQSEKDSDRWNRL